MSRKYTQLNLDKLHHRKRVVLYVRVSHNRRGVSIADQIRRLRNEAEAAGEEVVVVLVDEARSGTKVHNRSAYKELLVLVRAGQVDLIRIEIVSRGHRNELDRLLLEEEMRKLGVDVAYLGEPSNLPSYQREMYRGLTGTVASHEPAMVSQLTYNRMRYNAERGNWRGGSIPYGLLPDNEGWFKVDPDSYKFLLWILSQRALGLGHHTIAKTLNKGISIVGEASTVPPTPGLLAWRRRPTLTHWNVEINDYETTAREPPSGLWTATMVKRICPLP